MDAPRPPTRRAATPTWRSGGCSLTSSTKGNQLLGQGLTTTPLAEPVVVTGAGLGLPGGERVFGDDKVPALLAGEQLIDTIPVKEREKIVDKHITRLVKTEGGGARFEAIENEADVIKLAGRSGAIDLVEEFGFPAERAEALDVTSMLAIGAGLDALRDAGIPLVMRYKTATTGRMLPERWMLPEAYRDTTGVVFASAFPGYDSLVGELDRYHLDQALRQRVEDLRGLRARLAELGGGDLLAEELDHRIHTLTVEMEDHPYQFDRKFLFHALSMGHSQFAEYIGARGPNTQVNSACASTTQAVALAEDWIRAGRCERVVIVSGDDVTSDRLLEWMGAGFLASGAAATDDVVAEAAVPFDLRRHGMILGMGAAAIVVEAAASAERRGVQPIAQVLGTVTANSAFHGTRLDTNHISQVMEDLVTTAERRWGIDRHEIAPHTVFISHETYTPARGGSAQAEVDALRHVFGDSAGQVVISNTKGFTGHAMGVGIEDVVAIKAIETGIVPPVPNYKVPDPDLGELNLSQGGTYPVRYALRLGAGFGSQVSMTLVSARAAPRVAVTPSPTSSASSTASSTLRHGSRGWWRPAGCRRRSPRSPSAPCGSATTAHPRSGSSAPPVAAKSLARPVPTPREPDSAARASSRGGAPVAGCARGGCPRGRSRAGGAGRRRGRGAGAGDRGRADRLPLRPARLRPGPGSRPRHRHRQASRDLRRHPSRLRHRTRRPPRPARLPHPAPRDRLRPRTRPRTHRHRHRDPPRLRPVAEAAAAAPAGDGVEEQVLAIVAEQTGYPSDLLDLDLDLEADLGIDTVKQAETFAAIRAAYDIERDDRLALRDYPTLRHVIAFVYERAPALTATAATARRRLRPWPPAAGCGAGRRRGRGAGAGDRGRTDRLPLRPARLGPGPGSRPRHRHRQTSRDLRRHPSRLRHRTRRPPRPARLPHPAPRDRLRLRTRPRTHRDRRNRAAARAKAARRHRAAPTVAG